MRKVIVSNMVSLDGYFEGPDGGLDWHVVDEDFLDYAKQMLDDTDYLLFGRITYEMMAAYWPTPEAKSDDLLIAGKMNSLPKIVFSRSLDKVEWENSTLVRDNIEETILMLKEQTDKDLVILGSGSIVSAFAQMGLIDEYRIIINPVILGGGKPHFSVGMERIPLKLTAIKKLNSGVVILYYQPSS